jgi:hypothetical protein
LTFIALKSVHVASLPTWVRKGTTCAELRAELGRVFPMAQVNEKDKLQFSIGTLARVESLLSISDRPSKQKVRIDWVGHTVLTSVKELQRCIKKGETFALEVCFGTLSKFFSIVKQMSCRDLRNKIQNASPQFKLVQGATIFVHEKPKIRMDIEPDDLLFDSLKVFVPKLNRKHQRVCILVPTEDEPPVQPSREMKRSLSQILNGDPDESSGGVSP